MSSMLISINSVHISEELLALMKVNVIIMDIIIIQHPHYEPIIIFHNCRQFKN